MSELVNPILQRFSDLSYNLQALEKRLVTVYAKLANAANTPELSKCLSPEATDGLKHLQRLALIKLSISLKPNIKPNIVIEPLPKITKPSSQQDLSLIEYALILQNKKLAHYEFLHPTAIALGLENEAALIEQTISDNRNTNTWLRQIIQNIVVPDIRS